jgi:predicted RNase H-like HicB family nuclease
MVKILPKIVEMEAYYDGEAWCARGVDESIYTCADTLDALWERVQEAAEVHFDDKAVEVRLTILGKECPPRNRKSAVQSSSGCCND